jgi:putative RecB family exonuclease
MNAPQTLHAPSSPVTASAPGTSFDADASPLPGVAWVVDQRGNMGMTITDPDKLTRLRRKELSASTAFGLDPSKCAVGVVASRLISRNDELFEANQLGTAAHAVLEHLFSLDGPQRTQGEAIATSRRLHNDVDFALTLVDKGLSDQIAALTGAELERWYSEVDRRSLGLWGMEEPTEVNVHSTEMQFGERFGRVVKIGRVPFVGFIDRVDQIVNPSTGEITGYTVKDYKAGKVKQADRYGDDYGDQIRIYTVAVRESEGIDPEGGSLLFIAYGVERPIDTSAEAVAITIARFERAWDRMHELADSNFYPTKDGPLCGWCELVNACPSAAKHNRADLSNTEKVKGKRVAVEGKAKKGLGRVQLGIPTVARPVSITNGGLPATSIPTFSSAHSDVVALPDNAAHILVDPNLEKIMTVIETAAVRVKEGMARKDTHVDDSLNGNSFAAIAAFGLTERAVIELSKAGQPVMPASVRGLVLTYASIVQSIQFELSGTSSASEGINCRVRGALFASIETIPAPWGQPLDQWNAWAESVKKRTRAVSNVALTLVSLGADIPDAPWAALASDAQAA